MVVVKRKSRPTWGRGSIRAIIFGTLLVAVCLSPAAATEKSPASGRISSLGRYRGYSEAVFDGWVRTSRYVSVRDGTRIAIDIFRPTNEGALHAEALPVVWEHRRYQRAYVDENGVIQSQLDRQDHPMRKVVSHGYVFAVAAVRGSGASFGTRVDATPPQESLDAYDITEWLAAQRWCSGAVGMYGISYSGTAQFMAASTAPPHLKAIFPEMAMFDLYDFCYPGGIMRHRFMKDWAAQTRALDTHRARQAAPVDDDPDGVLLKQAVKQHEDNFDLNRVTQVRHRDTALAGVGRIFLTNNPSTHVERIRASHVAIYQRAGWFDMYPRDMLLWFCNLDSPKKIAIGPWNHYQSQGVDRGTELLRWFDYWLKDIDNGIMDESPVVYCVMDAPPSSMIRWTHQWPPPEGKPVTYYLGSGRSCSIDSVNDGRLSRSAFEAGSDSYRADYTTTSGSRTRWMPGAPQYGDMTANDRKALTYTTEPLSRDIEIVGHPVLHLWIQCSADDVDLFAYVEEVDAAGRSLYVTEGCLRASHRNASLAPYNRLGLPYHRSYGQDVTKLSDEPAKLAFDLHPTAKRFKAGHRIRVAITCVDKDSYQHIQHNSAPTLTVLRDARHRSHLVLPVIE